MVGALLHCYTVKHAPLYDGRTDCSTCGRVSCIPRCVSASTNRLAGAAAASRFAASRSAAVRASASLADDSWIVNSSGQAGKLSCYIVQCA